MMIFRRILDSRSAALLITFLMTYLMSSCSAEDNKIDSAVGFETAIEIVTEIVAESGAGVNVRLTDKPDTIQVSWIAPAEREGNRPLSLSEISGYRVYYGTRAGDYQNTIEVSDSTTENYIITDLVVGAYYIVLTAYDIEGRESLYSDEIVVIL